MRKIAVSAIGAVAMLGFAAPAMAHENDGRSQHDWRHDRLEQRHDNVHDDLGEEHADVHDQGLNRWEYRQLHDDLRYEHAEADRRISRDHRRQDRRNNWRQRSYGYGY